MSDTRLRKLEKAVLADPGNSGKKASLLRAKARKGSTLSTTCFTCSDRGGLGLGFPINSWGSFASECIDCDITGREDWPWWGDRGRISLLAFCGYGGAQILFPKLLVECSDTREVLPGVVCYGGAYPPWTVLQPDDISPKLIRSATDLEWLSCLKQWSREAMVRAMLSAAHVALPVWEKEEGRSRGVTLHRDHEDGPSVPTSALTADALEELLENWGRPRRAVEFAELWLQELGTVDIEENPCGGDWGTELEYFGSLIPLIFEPHHQESYTLERGFVNLSELADEETVLAAIRADLIEWALG